MKQKKLFKKQLEMKHQCRHITVHINKGIELVQIENFKYCRNRTSIEIVRREIEHKDSEQTEIEQIESKTEEL